MCRKKSEGFGGGNFGSLVGEEGKDLLKSLDEKGKVVKVRRGMRGGGGQKEDVVS